MKDTMWITFKYDNYQVGVFHNRFFWYNNCKNFSTKKRTVYLVPHFITYRFKMAITGLLAGGCQRLAKAQG